MSEEEDDEKLVISRFIIGGLYYAFSLVVLFLLVPIICQKNKIWQQMFYYFVFFGVLIKGASFTLQALIVEDVVEISNSLNVFVNTYPSFLFFSAYFVLLFLWIEIYNFTSENSSVGIREFRNLYIIINVGMHLVFWILFAIDFSVNNDSGSEMPSYDTKIQQAVIGFAAGIYLVLSVSYAFYSLKFYNTYQKTKGMGKYANGQRAISKLLFISLLFSIFFLVRFAIVIVGILTNVSAKVWWFDPVYYATLELGALIAMFFVFRAQPKFSKTTNSVRTSERASLISKEQLGWYSKGVSDSGTN